ncbi:MAG: UDP-glucose/GDP-mannose dehydrogenase family protein [Planctomycetota bacterium]
MRIAVVGTGYVGLVAGVCFADTGHEVVCVDVDAGKVEALEEGRIPIFEPGLQSLFARARREGRITFTLSHADAVKGAAVAFIGVGTPEGPDGAPVMDYVREAIVPIVANATQPLVLVLKSTVPVGTAAWVREIVKEHAVQPVEVVNNPEFLKEGTAVEDFLRPDRVVIGTRSDSAWATMQELYEPFTRSGAPILRMSNEAAELTKYAANAMLATRISFMNEIARLCDKVGADVRDVARGIGSDKRIGGSFLHAGCGYGGSCFPKDTQGLIHVGRRAGVDMKIVTAVEVVNDEQKEVLADLVLSELGQDLTGRRIALWGLAFKPQTDDVREAPALVVLQRLTDRGADVVGTDPEAIDTFRRVAGDRMTYVNDPYDAARGADAVVLCTEWNEYRTVDWAKLKGLMRNPAFFDGRNVHDPRTAQAAGFLYRGIGRGQPA